MVASCNICGGESFGPGPNGRKGKNGLMPNCLKCGSLERHRLLKLVWDELKDWAINKRTLQISPEPTIEYKDKGFFASHEISIYGGENSIDLQEIARADGVYDIIMCNHVLEHVENDDRALSELLRVARGGVIEMMTPLPSKMDKTIDWGKPDPSNHGHYRLYGRDIWKRFTSSFFVLQIEAIDPVTNDEDWIFFLSDFRINLEPVRRRLMGKFPISEHFVNLER